MQLKTLNHLTVVAVRTSCCTIQKLCILSTHTHTLYIDDFHKKRPLSLQHVASLKWRHLVFAVRKELNARCLNELFFLGIRE